MSLPLKRKLEEAFANYLASEITTGTALDGINIYRGRGTLSERTLPSVNVFVGELQINADFPPDAGEYIATIAYHNASQADDQSGSVAGHDARQLQLETIVANVTDAKAFINKPIGIDNRVIKDVYIYDIKEDSEQQDFKLSGDRTLDDMLTYKVPCRNDDGDGT